MMQVKTKETETRAARKWQLNVKTGLWWRDREKECRLRRRNRDRQTDREIDRFHERDTGRQIYKWDIDRERDRERECVIWIDRDRRIERMGQLQENRDTKKEI